MMVWIIAGNHKEAKDYAARQQLRRDQWQYLMRADQLPTDVAGLEVAWVGSCERRRDYNHLCRLLI